MPKSLKNLRFRVDTKGHVVHCDTLKEIIWYARTRVKPLLPVKAITRIHKTYKEKMSLRLTGDKKDQRKSQSHALL